MRKSEMELKEAIGRVYKKLMEMPDDEFRAKLEKHKDGYYSRILRETGAIDIISEQMQRDDILNVWGPM